MSGLYSVICSLSIGVRSQRALTDHGFLNTAFFRLLTSEFYLYGSFA